MDWDKLKIFYQVANAGSITTAAHKLNISQPALSRSILNLEARVGSKLFNRHKKGLTLTRQGEIIFRSAHKMYMESRNMETLLKEKEDSVEGELTILTTPTIASTWLIRFLPGYYELYPNVRIKIIGELVIDKVSNCDILLRPYIPMQPTLIQQHLTSFHMRLFASKAYLDKFGVPKKAEDLDHHRLITFGGDTFHPLGNINWILNVGRKPTSVREPFMQINTTQGLCRAAEAGLGIVELGKDYPSLEGVNLVEVLPELRGPEADLFFIYSEANKDSKKITTFLTYLKSKIDNQDGFQDKSGLMPNDQVLMG